MAKEEDNGNHSEVPETADVVIKFNPTLQTVELVFDNQEFKTWDFLLGILNMATQKAEQSRNFSIMANMQKQQQEAAALKNILRK